MRKISIDDGKILLNNRPLYQKLILDQGYWPESLLTAENDEAMKKDIQLVKEMGFNGIRLHQKIECSRFLYWADKLGLLVWEELPSAYQFGFQMESSMFSLVQDTIKRDRNHPSIICWVLLNESWGVRNIYANAGQQRFALAMYYLARALDNTRIVDTNDGWETVTSDLCTIHDYARNGEAWRETGHLVSGATQGRFRYAKGFHHKNEPILLTEFGGIAFTKDLHGRNWGYEKGEPDKASFKQKLSDLLQEIENNPDIQGFCYTQLTDVMQEVNGLLDEDRNPKIPIREVRELLQ
jgi:beta-galactosidase/beta-glucuronidase